MSLFLLASLSLLSLFASGLEPVHLPDKLGVVVELFFGNLLGRRQYFNNFRMALLVRPVGGTEPEFVLKFSHAPARHQHLAHFKVPFSRRDVQTRLPDLI